MDYLTEEEIENGPYRFIRNEEFFDTIENIDVLKQILSSLGFKLVLLEKDGKKTQLTEEEFHIVMLYIKTFCVFWGLPSKKRTTLDKMKKRLGIYEEKNGKE